MMFGAASALAKGPAAPKAAPPAPAPEPEPEAAGEHQAGAEPGADAGARTNELPLEEPSHEGGVEAEGAEQEEAPRPSTFDKAPPKGLLIGVAAGLAALIVAGGALVAVKKLGKRPPPPAAVETLSGAQADADKDTLASLSAAESKAKDALEVAGPKARFPQATAALARIEIQWADALNDQAALIAQKGGDGADAKVADLQGQAKAKLKSAFELLAAAVKTEKDSADLRVALADYYRAQRSNANMNKYLKLVKDDPRAQLIQGISAAQEEDGAEKAIPKLTAALSASPQSARIHFRLALAYLAMKDDAKGLSELKETLKISPQHERAKLVMEQVPASAEQK
jgi:tetratricopeptide (TPR) repeat protein